MTRDEALDLLALHASGDLPQGDTAQLEQALDDYPELRAELEVYRDLEDFMGDALSDAPSGAWAETGAGTAEAEAPAWLLDGLEPSQASGGAAPAQKAGSALVQRRCPYCHDTLASQEQVVLCAACATPHHGTCFADNQGCSLLGCESTRSADPDAPGSRRICPTCEGLSPAEAPFCAWCATPLGEEGARRRRGPAPWPLRQYLAAAGLLLSAAVGMGGYFGLQQESMAQQILEMNRQLEYELGLRDARSLLREIHTVQSVYAEEDLDGDGQYEWAPDLETLRLAVDDSLVERLGLKAFGRWARTRAEQSYYTVSIGVGDDGGQVVRARPTGEGDQFRLPELTCDSEGQITEVRSNLSSWRGQLQQ